VGGMRALSRVKSTKLREGRRIGHDGMHAMPQFRVHRAFRIQASRIDKEKQANAVSKTATIV
jgi:hypothetical protein